MTIFGTKKQLFFSISDLHALRTLKITDKNSAINSINNYTFSESIIYEQRHRLYMNIIESDIISIEYDNFWEDISPGIGHATSKPILVLVNSYEKGSAEETQLLKMIDACQLNPEQFNIIQLKENEKAAWYQLREKLNPRIIFLIGIHPIQLGISSLFRLNEANNFNNCVWLPTLAINELEKHKDIKKQLWINGINPIFINKQSGEI